MKTGVSKSLSGDGDSATVLPMKLAVIRNFVGCLTYYLSMSTLSRGLGLLKAAGRYSSATSTILAVLFVALGAGCRSAITHGDAQLPNFDMVSDSLYRGGQPTQEGFDRLHKMGVKTVVNVREGDTDRDLIKGMEFVYNLRGMSALSPCDEDVIWFLKIATNPTSGPIFLHCHYGADRTGYLIAMYRIVVQGWDTEKAITEMTDGGHGFWPLYSNLPDYVRRANIAALRKAVLPPEQQTAALSAIEPARPMQLP